MSEQELVEAPRKELSVFSIFDAQLAAFKEANADLSFDIETYEGEESCKKHLKNVGKLRIGVEKLRVSTKKEYVVKGREVDTEAKKYQAIISEIDAVHSVPLKALENKRIKEVLDKQEEERLEAKSIQDAKDAELEKLRGIVADQEAKEQATKDAVEAERQQAEADKKIEADKLAAVEEAKQQAEQKARDAIALVEQKAHDEKNALIAKQIEEKNAADKVALDILNEKKWADEQEEIRKADKEHRRDYNNLASQAIFIMCGDEEVSEGIVKAIVKGNVPNISMNY